MTTYGIIGITSTDGVWRAKAAEIFRTYDLMQRYTLFLEMQQKQKQDWIDEQCRRAAIVEEFMTKTNEAGNTTKDEDLKLWSEVEETKKVNQLREEGGRLWRSNNELKKEIAMGEKKVKELDELITRHKATLDLLAKPTRPALDKEDILEQIEHLFFEIKHDNLEKSCILNAAHILHNRIKGGAFDLPKRWVLNRTFTYSGMFGPGPTPEEIKSAEETMSKYKPETEPARTPIQKAEDLVGFYNKPEPAQECGCLDKAKLLDRLKVWMKTDSEEIKSALEEGDFTTAARYKASLTNHLHIEGLILRGKFDRAPCTPEPAGEVIGFVDKTHLKIQLDDGRFVTLRCGDHFELPKVTKPALDKNWISRDLEGALRLMHLKTTDGIREDIEKVQSKIKTGKYDLPATDRPREHKCRCPTANLVEQLRARANLADGIDVTDLDADQLLTVGWNRPATVIMVRKEDRS